MTIYNSFFGLSYMGTFQCGDLFHLNHFIQYTYKAIFVVFFIFFKVVFACQGCIYLIKNKLLL